MKDTRVIIFEDKTDLREGLKLLVNGTPGYSVLDAHTDCSQVQKIIVKHNPDVVLMDIDMPFVNGIEGLKIIKKIKPEIMVIMLTVFDQDEHIFEAMKQGADGYLLKRTSPADIIKAIDEVLEGGAPMTPAIARKVISFFSGRKPTQNKQDQLTPKETEVLKLLVDGFSYKMIASELEVSIDTIRSHIKNTYRKLHVNSMSEAVAKAIKQRLV